MPVSRFGIYIIDDIYQQFTFVIHTGQPSLLAPFRLGASASSLTTAKHPCGEYIVEGASDKSVTSIACPCRLQSVARLVNYQRPLLATGSNNDKSDSYAVRRIRVAQS
nr:hypothetical protein 398p2_00055 [Serratia entomophila]